MKLPRFALLFFVLLAVCPLLLLSGCRPEDQIQTYRVPRPKPPHRMLGAIVPQGEKAWFFKVAGADDVVAEQVPQFEAFIKSVRFGESAEADPSWELPAGWTQSAGESMRFATINIPTDASPLELSVIPLPGQAGEEALVANINRWRGQLGLGSIDAAALGEQARQLDLDGRTATLVNMIGTLGQSAPMAGPFSGGAAPGPASAGPAASAPPGGTSELTYEAPATWQPGQLVVSRGGISIRRDAAFVIGDNAGQAEVTITSLPGSAGVALPNVNRWRRQVGLNSFSREELAAATEKIEIDGEPADYYRLIGPEQAILGVIANRNGKAWFVKLLGPHDAAGKLEDEFKTFARSIKF